MDIPENYIVAEGPEGLKKILNELLEKSRKDPMSVKEDHHILYQLGNQKSMIRVDTTQSPFYFWYYDLMGRPMTSVVQETLEDFLWENWGK